MCIQPIVLSVIKSSHEEGDARGTSISYESLEHKEPRKQISSHIRRIKAVLENTTETTSFHVKDERETKENRLKAA